MTEKPEFIDNLNGNTMTVALRNLLNEEQTKTSLVVENKTKVDEARIATAYFSPEGFSRIAKAIKDIKSIKLMRGSDPIDDAERWQRKLEETEERFIARRLRENLKNQEKNFRAERNHIPFTRKASDAVKQLVNSLRAGNMEVRRYEDAFLHAKAYIFSSSQTKSQSKLDATFVGSSNLTASGLSSNLELNLGTYDDKLVGKAKYWYDQLWEQAVPFDLASFFDEIFEPKTPYEIFLRVLLELYGKEIETDF